MINSGLGRLRSRVAASLLPAVLGLAFSALSAHAQNLLQNGGFESSTFTSSSAQTGGWGFASPPPNFSDTRTATVPSWTWTADPVAGSNHNNTSSTFGLSRAGPGETATVVDGTLAVAFGAGSYSGGGSIAQNFSPTAGSLYIGSLWVTRIGAGEAISAAVTIRNNADASTVLTVPIDMSAVASGQWKQVTFTFTAPSNNLSFSFNDTTAYGAAGSTDLGLDNVSIQAASTQTLTILGGSGTTGDFAPNTEFSNDGGSTWHPAYLVGSHPWGFIPGTNNWINQAPNETTGLYQTTLFRIKFTAPAIMASPDMKFAVNADNYGTMSINGQSLGETEGGSGPAPVYDVGANFIVPGVNTIVVALRDVGGLVAINYRVDLTAIAAQPITVVQLPPSIVVPSSLSGRVGTAFSYQVGASNSPTSYSASGLPANLSLNSISGLISGTPMTAGSYALGLAASNAAGTGSASTTLNIAKGTASVSLSNLTQTYTGSPLSPTATTNPGGLNVVFSTTPTNAGSYGLIGSISDANYAGSASGTFTITRATAIVTITNTAQSYDGTPKPVTVTTTPANLATSVTYDGANAAPSALGSYAVSARVTNSNYTGAATGTLVIADTAAPQIIAPRDITAEATSALGAVVTFTATADDNVDGSVVVTATPASGSTFALGATPVTLTATDRAGNVATSRFTVTVQDTTAPKIGTPANVIAEATSAAGATVTFNATATDIVDGNVVVSASAASGSTFQLGTTAVTLTATDAHGNRSSSTFNVTVQDTTAPQLTVPASRIVEAASAAGSVVNFTATAADAVTASPAIGYSVAPGSVFGLGTSTVNVTATDAAGNKSTGAFTVTVRDTTSPQLAVPADLTLEATSAAGAVATFTATATDAVTASPAIGYSAAPGSTFALGTTAVTVTATDAAGNSTTGSFNVSVRDTTAPVLTVPANLTLEATSAAGATANFAATATDIVTTSPTITYSVAPGSTFALGTAMVNVSATDGAGNVSRGSFTVTIRDTTPPVISSLTSSVATLWAPDHKMRPIALTAAASDTVGVAGTKIISVTSNEPTNTIGDGNTAGDWLITGALTLELRAERSGAMSADRIYTITVESRDAAGNASTRAITINVPKSQGGK